MGVAELGWAMPPILQTREPRVRASRASMTRNASPGIPLHPPPRRALPGLCWGTGDSVLQEPLLVTAGRQVQPSGLGLPEAWPQPLLLVSPVSSCTRGGQAGQAPAAGGGADGRGRATLTLDGGERSLRPAPENRKMRPRARPTGRGCALARALPSGHVFSLPRDPRLPGEDVPYLCTNLSLLPRPQVA